MKINHKISNDILEKVINDNYVHEMDEFLVDFSWHQSVLDKKEYSKIESPYPGNSFLLHQNRRDECHQAIRNIFPVELSLEHDTGWLASIYQEHQKNIKKVTHHDAGYLNLIIYLFHPHDEKHALEQGTTFQMSKKLKLTRMNLKNHKEAFIQSQLFEIDQHKPNSWETWKAVPAKFNKALLYNGSLWHSIPQTTFGHDLNSGRLTQNFFIKIKDRLIY